MASWYTGITTIMSSFCLVLNNLWLFNVVPRLKICTAHRGHCLDKSWKEDGTYYSWLKYGKIYKVPLSRSDVQHKFPWWFSKVKRGPPHHWHSEFRPKIWLCSARLISVCWILFISFSIMTNSVNLFFTALRFIYFSHWHRLDGCILKDFIYVLTRSPVIVLWSKFWEVPKFH